MISTYFLGWKNFYKHLIIAFVAKKDWIYLYLQICFPDFWLFACHLALIHGLFKNRNLYRRNFFWSTKRLIFTTKLHFFDFFLHELWDFWFLLTEILLKESFLIYPKDWFFLQNWIFDTSVFLFWAISCIRIHSLFYFFDYMFPRIFVIRITDLLLLNRNCTKGVFSDLPKDWFLLQSSIFWFFYT